MVRQPTFVTPTGSINGDNRTFTVPIPYVAGSLAVWQNGLVLRADYEDGWVETSSTTFQMKEAPRIGDSLTVYFVPKP